MTAGRGELVGPPIRKVEGRGSFGTATEATALGEAREGKDRGVGILREKSSPRRTFLGSAAVAAIDSGCWWVRLHGINGSSAASG